MKKFTPQQFAVWMKAFPKRLEKELKAAEIDTISRAWKIAYQQSSGPFSQAMLNRLGHPYSKRKPNSTFDPGLINVQTGQFRAAWTTTYFGWSINSANVTTGELANSSAHALLLLGTPYMIVRPIEKRIIKAIKPIRWKNLNRAVTVALTP